MIVFFVVRTFFGFSYLIVGTYPSLFLFLIDGIAVIDYSMRVDLNEIYSHFMQSWA